MIQIKLDPQGELIVMSLTSYLGGDRFRQYRALCYEHGARWDVDDRCNYAPVDALPGLLASLRETELPVEIDTKIRDILNERAAEAEGLLAAGRERVDRARERLAPRDLALYRYQETGVEWLAPRKRALLADEMGLGKTVQALLSLPDRAAALVICPAAVRSTWLHETLRWRPDLTPRPVQSRSQFRWPRAGELLVCTYGILPKGKEVERLGPPPDQTYVIADEAHALKNAKAARTRAFRKMSKVLFDHGCAVWLLTGTPLLNRPPELWQVLQAADLGRDSFGTWANFCSVFRAQRTRFGMDWDKPSDEAPQRLRQVSLHRRRVDVLPDLPTKTRNSIRVKGIDMETAALCDQALATLESMGIDWEKESRVANATRISRTAFTELSRARSALATSKIPHLLEIVETYEENEEPLIVFSVHKAPILVLGSREGWATITGETPSDERGRIVERFQNGELRGLAGTVQAMGVGVTLTHASHAVFVDLAWTPALNQQAEDRLCRIGQDRGVIIVRMVSDHRLDERVLELLTLKQKIIEASIEASAVEADHVHASPADDLAKAAQGMSDLVVDIEAQSAQTREQIERETAVTTQRRIRALKEAGVEWDGRDLDIRGTKRSAANDLEERSAIAVQLLADCDPDHAAEKNNVGFSKWDNEMGHSFAEQIKQYGRLSDKQWAIVVKMAIRYRRQTGDPREAPAE